MRFNCKVDSACHLQRVPSRGRARGLKESEIQHPIGREQELELGWSGVTKYNLSCVGGAARKMPEGQLPQVQLRRNPPHRFHSPPVSALEPSADAAKRLSSSSSPCRLRSNSRKARPLSTPLPLRGSGLSVQALRPLSCTSPPCTLGSSTGITRHSNSSPVSGQHTLSSLPCAQEPNTRAARRMSGLSPPHGTGPNAGAAKRLSGSSPPRGSTPKVGSPKKCSSSSPTHGMIPTVVITEQFPSSSTIRDRRALSRKDRSLSFSKSVCRLMSDAGEDIDSSSSLPTRGSRPSVGVIRKLPSSLSISSSLSPSNLSHDEQLSGQINSLTPSDRHGQNNGERMKLSSMSPVCKLRPKKGRTKQVSFSLPLEGLDSAAEAAIQPNYSSQPIKMTPKMGIPVKISSSAQCGSATHSMPNRQSSFSSIPRKMGPTLTEGRQLSASPSPTSMLYPKDMAQNTPPVSPHGFGPFPEGTRHASSSGEPGLESRLEEAGRLSYSSVRHSMVPSLGASSHLLTSSIRQRLGSYHGGFGMSSLSSQNRLRPGDAEAELSPYSLPQQGPGASVGVFRKRLSSSSQHGPGPCSSTDRHAFSSSIPCRMGSSPGVTWRFCGSSPTHRLESSVGTKDRVSITSLSHDLWPTAREICYSPPFKLEPSAVAARRLSSFSAQCGGKY
ncbi:uncharacterized protein LOC144784043 [Lissotriton helveticus]